MKPNSIFKIDLIILFVCAFILFFSVVLNVRNTTAIIPFTGGTSIPELCLFKNITNQNCPTCGITRSFVSISHMDFTNAWKFNRLGLPAYLLCIFQIPYRLARVLRRKDSRFFSWCDRISVWWIFLITILLGINWIFSFFIIS